MKHLLFFVLITIFLTACNSMQPAPAMPTVSQTPTASETATETETPTPEATATAEPTATPEVKQFPICQIEKFRDCPTPLDDIYNGNVDRWLNTLSKPFDPAKINDVPLVWYHAWDTIQYNVKNAPNFKVLGPPQHRDTTAGYIVYEKDGVKYEYIFLPVEFYDNKTGKSYWVKTVAPIYPENNVTTKEAEKFYLSVWRNKMKITTIYTNNLIPWTKTVDPLVAITFEKYPDMADRFQKFVDGDMTALSESDMIFSINIAENSGHWYE